MNISKEICRLREAHHLTQEEFAKTLCVSLREVQAWERGESRPDPDELAEIARRFQTSVDLLPGGGAEPVPNFAGMHEWEVYSKSTALEYRQSTEEGRDLTAYKDVFCAVENLPDGPAKEQLADVLFHVAHSAPVKADFVYREPSVLEEIRALREPCDLQLGMPSRAELEKKVRGAWLGRIAGCLLGKPIEGIRTDELIPLLRESGNYPMRRYIRSTDISEEMYKRFRFQLEGQCWPDVVSAAPADDDTNYTVLAQLLIEKYGRDFTPADVGALWLARQGKNAYCTAERVAFRNLVNGYAPPDSAMYKNPYREWIGAQIRADYFGYINPGNPELAAEMAWRDASISHVKNGIYGEMFVAAMLSCAAACDDAEAILRGGLAQIPATSRLYREAQSVLDGFLAGMDCEASFAEIHRKYDEFNAHDWCHTISNAMIVAAALLYGRGDFGRSICLAVQTGFDTDCNGATVGSIVGMQKGAAAIDQAWTQPLHGKLETSIFGVGTVSIDELVEKTLRHIYA